MLLDTLNNPCTRSLESGCAMCHDEPGHARTYHRYKTLMAISYTSIFFQSFHNFSVHTSGFVIQRSLFSIAINKQTNEKKNRKKTNRQTKTFIVFLMFLFYVTFIQIYKANLRLLFPGKAISHMSFSATTCIIMHFLRSTESRK